MTFGQRRRHPVQERRLLRLGHLDRGGEGVRRRLEHAGAEQEHEIQPALAPVDLRAQAGDLRLDHPAEHVEAKLSPIPTPYASATSSSIETSGGPA